MKTVQVHMLGGLGRPLGGIVTDAASAFEAARQAWTFFHSPQWLGPLPTRDTLFRIESLSTQETWTVRADVALGAVGTPSRQLPLLDIHQNALDPR